MFEGFTVPESNYFKLPNEWINIMSGMTSLAEVKVVIYILRHTWGFQEFNTPKKITLDEFQHGRKNRDGTRLDLGIGMSEPAVIRGLKSALEHGYIDVKVYGQDKGRRKKFYQIQMKSDLTKRKISSNETLEASLTKRKISSNETLDRSEKDTFRKTPLEINKRNSRSPEGDDDCFLPKSNGDGRKDFARLSAETLYDDLAKKRKIFRKVRIDAWANEIRKFIQESTLSEYEFGMALEWYVSNIGEKYVPQAYSAQSFCNKFANIQERMYSQMDEGLYAPDDPPEYNNDDDQSDDDTTNTYSDEKWKEIADLQDREEMGMSEDEYITFKVEYEKDNGTEWVSPYLNEDTV